MATVTIGSSEVLPWGGRLSEPVFRALRTLAVLCTGAASAWAGDWYVDALNGDDANGGTSPADAWKTITHALATAPAAPPAGTQTIHIAPGTYDSALGEVFPLLPRDAFELVGDGGPDVTLLDAGGTGSVFQAWISHFGGNYTGPLTRVQGLRLENADIGFDIQASVGTEYLTIQDCRVFGVNLAGIYTGATCFGGCGSTDVRLERVELIGCGDGIQFTNGGTGPTPTKLSVVDSVIVGSSIHGIFQYDTGGGTELELLRTSIRLCGGEALWLLQDNLLTSAVTHATVTDCLIGGNAIDGIKAELARDNITNSTVRVDVVRSTIADNYYGVEAFCPTGWSPDVVVTLCDTIVYGNFDDLHENPAHPAFTSVTYCDIGDGDFAGSKGNFAADPLFVDGPGGDYRLRWSSPCIETGDPAGVAGTPDLAHHVRPIDGELDTLESFDVGAYEFAPLYMHSTGELGTPLVFELWGPQGNATTVWFARTALVAPQPTPFGELDLDPAFMNVFRVTTVGSGPPRIIKRTIPTHPSYAGLVFSFQALTDCSAAPLGKAYTNAVELTLVP